MGNVRILARRDSFLEKIMLTGITGFVGERLAKVLLDSGLRVRALVRNPARLTWSHPGLEVVKGDVREAAQVREAMEGCSRAYYLVHGLAEDSAFEHEEAKAAQVFASSCRLAGIKKIIYLGGLGDTTVSLSPHLRSRHLTGDILRIPGIPVTEFRASIVIGRGSTSFAILSSLVRRLPFFVEPRNLKAECQPIHVDDLLSYLIADAPEGIYEIGGPDRVTYAELLLRTARASGLSRKLIPVPPLEVLILKEAFELICPEYSKVGGHLFESLVHPTVVTHHQAVIDFPQIRPVGVDEALRIEGGAGEEQSRLLSPAHLAEVIRMLESRFDAVKVLKPHFFSFLGRFSSI